MMILIFIILPWFYLENTELGGRIFSTSKFIYFVMLVSLILVFMNAKSSIKLKGGERLASIIFIIPPALVLIYFILGYIAFTRLTFFG